MICLRKLSTKRCLGNGFAFIKSAIIVLTPKKLLVLALIIIESMAKLLPVLVVLVLSTYWIEQTLLSENTPHSCYYNERDRCESQKWM